MQLNLDQFLTQAKIAISRLELVASMMEMEDQNLVFGLMVRIQKISTELNSMAFELEQKLPTALDNPGGNPHQKDS
jgi:hypothetical protein